MTAAIKASKLVVRKGRVQILNQLSFEVQSGTVTGLIGPSGSGKTTLMRAIVGVQVASGELTVLGQEAGSKSLRHKIGYVTQSPAVYSDLSVLQNLRYFGSLVGADNFKVDEVIEQVRLEKQHGQVVESLSGGQKARVGLAVALLGNPDLLVLDEPTVGLDPVLRNELWELFTALAKSGKTLLISSHVMDEAERCDNLLLVRDGKLLWHESLKKLLDVTKKSSVGDAFITVIHAAEKAERMSEEKGEK
ncbi:MAG: Antibiotic resistance transporter, efflux system, ATP-binding protein [Candidatus Saccharibacteria bacterium]|nr:Antibiotic resistance transporter, efflux system, ATP-binding protein [Candidatus Saccharibacteria bacterium]